MAGVQRVAVRFASPTRIAGDLTTHACRVDDATVGFEARRDGAGVITHGRMELRP
jgi:hypothetical protein